MMTKVIKVVETNETMFNGNCSWKPKRSSAFSYKGISFTMS